FATLAIHAGQPHDKTTGAVIPPISLSTTFAQSGAGVPLGAFDYSRSGNPNRNAFEAAVAALEDPFLVARHRAQHPADSVAPRSAAHLGTVAGVAFASGSMATAAITHLLPHGAHVISINDTYGGTYRYFTTVAATSQGLTTSFLALGGQSDADASADAASGAESESSPTAQLRRALRDPVTGPRTRCVWIESPTNPTLRLADIAALRRVLDEEGRGWQQRYLPPVLLVVDNTFMSPYLQNPLSLGADVVLHSVTKYLNGHSDVVMGMVVPHPHLAEDGNGSGGDTLLVPSDSLLQRLRKLQNTLGGVPAPFDCWLAHRGLKTLPLRMQQHSRNALAVAEAVERHCVRRGRYISEVIYPGLPSHPQHALARRQHYRSTPADPSAAHGAGGQLGHGGMLTLRLSPARLDYTNAFLGALRHFTLAESLGGVESLAEVPAIMTHAALSEAARAAMGIDVGLIRLSCGIEGTETLVEDILHAAQTAWAQ
ncbi:hypothetical protein CXG81DRAFT_4024, partial [Caulochytrium protostelioides]